MSEAVQIAAITSAAAVICALVAAAFAAFSAWFGGRNSRKLDEIHVLVNSRLTSAIEEIAALKEIVRRLGGTPPPSTP